MTTKKWTDDEKIVLFKFVKKHGRNWKMFAPYFEVSPNAARKCYDNTNWDSLIKNDEEGDIEEKTVEERVEEKLEKEINSVKQKLIRKNEEKKYKEHIERIAAENVIFEKLASVISSIPEINPVEIKYPKNMKIETRDQEAVLLLSDLHVGLAVLEEEVGGLSKYNPEIFVKRLESLIEKVAKITEHHRKCYRINKINIFGLGDFVHGSNDAGKWGFLHTEQKIVEQVFILLRELVKAILKLNQVFEEVNFYGVVGNHGRIGKKGTEKRYSNWDYVVYQVMSMFLENQKNINFEIPKTPFHITNILGNKFLMTHGDHVRSWSGLPFYGMVRTESKLRSMLEKNKNVENLLEIAQKKGVNEDSIEDMLSFALQYSKSFDYLIMGHFHQMAELETGSGGRIIMNSSFSGGDDYSINSLFSASTASQKLFGVHNQGKSWSYDIELDRK